MRNISKTFFLISRIQRSTDYKDIHSPGKCRSKMNSKDGFVGRRSKRLILKRVNISHSETGWMKPTDDCQKKTVKTLNNKRGKLCNDIKILCQC